MANELSASVALRFTKGNVDVEFHWLNKLFTVAGTDYTAKTQTIGTSEEALDIGDCAAGGMICVVNLDPTNYVSIRAATGGTNCVRVNALEGALFRFDAAGAAAPFAIANTGACQVAYLLVEP